MKPHNILANRGNSGTQRFSEVVLADLGDTVHKDHQAAKKGFMTGAPIFRSPEASFGIPWGTATDIWSFGATVS